MINEPNQEAAAGGTIQFSLDKTKFVTPSSKAEIAKQSAQEKEEQELLAPQAVPTEFEDVFSDDGIEVDSNSVSEGVVGIEEVFAQKAEMINEDFHNETGEEPSPHSPGLRKAAIIIGVISGAIILAAIAVTVIILI